MFKFIFLFLVASIASAGVIDAPVNPIDYEQNPNSIVWKTIDTENFELIFPEEVSDEAQRVAELLEKVYPFVTRSMEVKPGKIPLVLQNQSVVSNGFVTLAPRRSEWYLTPATEPELANTEWLKTLAIHEFRHVVQFERGRTGFTKALEFFLGEIGQAIGLGIIAPPWLYEGDAVGIETALTNGGRGRLPIFDRDLRTLLVSGKNFSYDKAHLGSFKDYVPNHYVYGYFYTSYIRNEQGDFALSRLMYHAGKNGWNPLTFYNTMDDTFRKDFEVFYKDVMGDLLSHWKKKTEELRPTPYEIKSPKKKFGWANYSHPQFTKDGKILALRSGLSYVPQFIEIDGKNEKVLFTPAPLQNEHPYRLRDNKIAFVEWELDPRWGYRDFGRLRVYDLDKDEFILEKKRTKLRLAVLSPGGATLAAVEWDTKQSQNLVVMDLSGKILWRKPFTKKEVITSFDWLNEQEFVAVLKDRSDQKKIVKIHLGKTDNDLLYGPVFDNLGNIVVSQGRVLVEAPQSGIDNIYLFDNGKLRQVTSALFGAYSPTIENNKLVYSDYTVDGLQIVKKELPWEEEQNSSDSFVPVYEKFASFEGKEKLDLSEGLEKFEIKPYSQVKNSLNFHSWMILIPPLSPTLTLQAYSRDILNKFSLSFGGEYNLNERATQGFVSAAWSHLYPVFDLRAAYGGRRQDFKLGGGRKTEDKWEEGTAEAGMSIPWQKLSGEFSQKFSFRAFSKLIKVTNKLTRDRSIISDSTLFSPGAQLSYSFLSRMSRRDLYPRLGVAVLGRVEEGKDISGKDQEGSLTHLDSRFYLPGIFKHHSLYAQLAYERQRDDFYQYASGVLYPRGTKSTFLQEFMKYSINYSLPVAYTDWNLSRYFYLKRISLNLFYDSLEGRYRSYTYEASSLGWELLFDSSFLRIALPITWGVRGSYVQKGLDKDQNYEVFLTSVLGVF